MREQKRDLKALEHWMQTVIMHPGGMLAATTTREARDDFDVSIDEIDQVVKKSEGLTAAERLGIYNHAYFARLQECLRAEFPVLLHAIGEKLFALFTLDYLQHYPSRSFTLNRLGGDFQEYLAKRCPDSQNPPDARESWLDFIIDLATFERAFNEVLDGPGVEGQKTLDADRPAGTTRQMLEARFVPVVCLRTFSFRYPVSQYFKSVRKNERPDLPEQTSMFLAMTRRDYVVRIYELTHTQYEVLSAIIAGHTLKRVIESLIETVNKDTNIRISTLFAWINDWAAKGFFERIEH